MDTDYTTTNIEQLKEQIYEIARRLEKCPEHLNGAKSVIKDIVENYGKGE